MDSWEFDLAKEFKKRNNKQRIGACIGLVISPEPLSISLDNGTILLDEQDVYICNQLLQRKSKVELSANQSQSGTLNGSDYTATGAITVQGDITLKEVWKAGDYVLVIPTENQDKFFIVDILKKV